MEFRHQCHSSIIKVANRRHRVVAPFTGQESIDVAAIFTEKGVFQIFRMTLAKHEQASSLRDERIDSFFVGPGNDLIGSRIELRHLNFIPSRMRRPGHLPIGVHQKPLCSNGVLVDAATFLAKPLTLNPVEVQHRHVRCKARP